MNPWLERELSLPFDRLSGEEFELFCYLLLRQEHPEEEIVRYGKTADLGRDIVWRRPDGSLELIQCKRYDRDLSIGQVRNELAKLFTNLFKGTIPQRPTRISFYVALDLTSPARNLLTQEVWVVSAERALTDYSKTPSPDLLDFARTWWPSEGIHAEPGVHLTVRAELHPTLVERFFRVKMVIATPAGNATEGSRRAGVGTTWEDFFNAHVQNEAARPYLADWPGLSPKDRFEPPREFPEIQESVRSNPLTILIGPPAAGKTFIAIQVLWDEFRQGHPVRWIAPTLLEPTEGPIQARRALYDMRRRIENLTQTLGPEPSNAPLDSHDFIAKNLKPGSTVYIEDPFGRTDEDFEYSLHTYSFFDLDACVRAISEGAARQGCHILLSSREGLFERWQAERARQDLPPLPAELIRISGDSYTYQQQEELAARLARAKGLEQAEDIAIEIGTSVELPYEVETIVRSLAPDAGPEQAAAEALKFRNGWKSALRETLVAQDPQETLFLVILASGCTDPKTRYLRFHRALNLSGDAEASLDRAVERYRAFIIRRPAHRLGDYGPEADEVFSPSHSVVEEGITEYLRDHASPLLEHLASVLPQDALNRKSAGDGADIALHLLSLGTGSQPGPAQDGILHVLLDRGGLSLHHVRDLMRLWNSQGSAVKDRVLAHLKAGLSKMPRRPVRSIRDLDGNTRTLLLEVASNLTLVEVPAEDAWRITALLFRGEVLRAGVGRGMYTWESPWSYLFEHLEHAPDAVLRFMERFATERPALFVYSMGEIAVAYWEKLPESYKAAFFKNASLKSPDAQRMALQGIAQHWERAPEELRNVFHRQARNEDPEIRAAAVTAAWIYRRDNPVLHEVLLNSARDPDITVPLRIMDSLGNEEVDGRFARLLLARVDANQAAEMIYDLLKSSGEPLPKWRLDLARDCLVKGGDRAWSNLGCLHFGDREAVTEPLHEWRSSVAKEPEPIRLGALWAYGLQPGVGSKFAPDDAVSLIKGLGQRFRSLALAYLSARVNCLPSRLQDFLGALEAAEDADGNAVRMGKEKRDSGERLSPWSFLTPVERLEDKAAGAQPGLGRCT